MKPNWENHMARSCGYEILAGISPKMWFLTCFNCLFERDKDRGCPFEQWLRLKLPLDIFGLSESMDWEVAPVFGARLWPP